MPLNLITGLPRNGKTLYMLQFVQAWAAREGRQVFYNGIAQLKLPWTEWEVEKWEQLPPRSIFVIDECQFKFPLRGRGEPPDFINKLATHGHLGLDFVLLTQDPMLIDAFVRKLCQNHKHVVRVWGMQRATIHEFTTGVRDNAVKSRKGSIEHKWSYPKKLFGQYHSADAHTVTRHIPMRVWILLSLPFIIGGLAWLAWTRYLNPDRVAAKAVAALPAGSVAVGGGGGGKLTPKAYVEQFAPRVVGLAYTAPVYDEVTKPTEAPYPAACYTMTTKGCRCFTQQGTKLDVPVPLCESIVAGGFFIGWKQPVQTAAYMATAGTRVEAVQAVPSISLGGESGGFIKGASPAVSSTK